MSCSCSSSDLRTAEVAEVQLEVAEEDVREVAEKNKREVAEDNVKSG